MVDKIYTFFEHKNYKEIMVLYLYFMIIFILSITLIIDILRDYYLITSIKVFMLVVLVCGSYFYRRSVSPYKVETYITLLIILSEITLTVIVFKQDFLDYSTVYPMLITFAIFYFYRLNKIWILTLSHHLYWVGVYYVGYLSYQDHQILHNTTAMVGMAVSYLFMNLFGSAYYVSTDIYQRQLERSNAKQEALLKEIHHRIKNSLNLVSSILGLQQQQLTADSSRDCKKALEDSRLRISAISLVHNTLYKEADFASINFASYVDSLSSRVLSVSQRDIDLQIEIDDVWLDSDRTLMLGIIINELLTNSLKYAFGDEDSGSIVISFAVEDGLYTLLYRDYSDKITDTKVLYSSRSLGIRLVKIAVDELDAELFVECCGGLSYKIIFRV